MAANSEPYGPPWPFDPLDLPSGTHAMNGREMTFREMQEYCAQDMRSWDRFPKEARHANQLANDPHYKPIQPFEGLKRRRRRV